MTSAVSGTRRQMRELVDGTIEVKIHIDPMFRDAFLTLFPHIDMGVALAPLANGPAPQPEPASICATETQKPAPVSPGKERTSSQRLSEYSAILCKNDEFRLWLSLECTSVWQRCHETALFGSTAPSDDPALLEEAARLAVYELAGVKSRADLDEKPGAHDRFHALVRAPFREWRAKVTA
jgi:hypothetical protein